MNNDSKLKEALEKYFNDKYKYDPHKESTLSWEFTKEYDFEKKVGNLINSEKKFNRKHSYTPIKRIIVAIIILLIVLTSAMSVPAFRQPVIDFVVKQYNKFSSYFVDEESLQHSKEQLPMKIENVYMPSKIPNNYEMVDYYADDLNTFALWSDESNNTIEFYQKVIFSYNNFNTENTVMNEIEIDNRSVYQYTQKETTSYIWYDKGYTFIINVSKDFSLKQVSELINSIKQTDY